MTEQLQQIDPAQFLTDPAYAGGDDPEDANDQMAATPLERLADLERRMRWLEDVAARDPFLPFTEAATASDPAELLVDDDRADPGIVDAYVDQVETLPALVTQIEGIVKKSTSKVSLEVKAAINAWRAATIEGADGAETPSTGAPEPSAPPVPSTDEGDANGQASHGAPVEGSHTRIPSSGGPDFCQECSDLAGDWVPWPCPAQPVEEWRAYATPSERSEP